MSEHTEQSEKDVDDIVSYKVKRALSKNAEKLIQQQIKEIENDDKARKTGIIILILLFAAFIAIGFYLS